MWKRLIALAVILVSMTALLGACRATGKVAGEAAESIEKGAKDFKQGFEEGKD